MRASSFVKVCFLQSCGDAVLIALLPFVLEPLGSVEVLPLRMILDHSIDACLCGPQQQFLASQSSSETLKVFTCESVFEL